MNRFAKIYLFGSLLAGLLFLLLLGFWTFYPYRIIEFKDEFFPVLTKTVKPGDDLVYVANACKYMNIGAIVSRSFDDELTYPLASNTSHRVMGCQELKVSVRVPNTLMADTYRLKTTFTYKVNPIREISIVKYTDYFTVK